MRNVGIVDRVVRIVIGAALLGTGMYLKAWWGVIGVVPLFTAFIGFCPLYRLVGLSTCPVRSKETR